MNKYYALEDSKTSDSKNQYILEINPNEKPENRIIDLYGKYSFELTERTSTATYYNLIKNSLDKKVGTLELDNKTFKLKLIEKNEPGLNIFQLLMPNPTVEMKIKTKKRKIKEKNFSQNKK